MEEPQTEDTSSLQAEEAGCSEATTNGEDGVATSEGNVDEALEEMGNESRTVNVEENPSADENTLENNDDAFLDEEDIERRDESMDKEYKTDSETDNTLFSPTADENKTTADQTEHEDGEQDGNDQLNESLTEFVPNSGDVANMEEEQGGLETEDLLFIPSVDEGTLQEQNAAEGEQTEGSNVTLNNIQEDNTPGNDAQQLLQEFENGEQDESLSQFERNSASDVFFEPRNKEEHDIEQLNVSMTESEKPENADQSVKVPDETSTLESERLPFEQTEDENGLNEYQNGATESDFREQSNIMQTDREFSTNGARSVLDQFEKENKMLQQEKSDIKMENSGLYSQIQDDGKSPAQNGSTEGDERPGRSDHLMDEDISEDPVPTGTYYTDDDFSSIFSDDDRDMNDILQENKILKEAMRQLKNNDMGVLTDTVSETSDDFDDMYPYDYGGDSKIKRSAWMAGKDLSDAKYYEVLREKRDTEAKMRQLEREKTLMERKYKQDKMERDFMEDRYNLKSAKLEDEIRNLRQENQRLRQTGQQEKLLRPTTGPKKYGSEKDIGFSISSDNEDNVPAGKNGYAIDIAVLAKENEKLSEIIDHLQLNTSTPRNDSVNDFVEAMERYVPKEEFIRVESEKLGLETVVREKERALKELERLMDETKFDLEEENRILKDSFKKAENKNKEKTRLLSDYDLQMVDIKAKCAEKISKIEKDLQMEISKKMKLENVILNLKKCNENFENEMQEMSSRIQKLQNQEAKLEDRHRREIAGLEDRLRKEMEEKNKLGRNVEALLQDLMQLKNKMLEEAEKHAREREQLRSSFESEKLKILAELGEEKKRSEQLIRRMAEIPGETIVAVMEGQTESGCYEGTFNDNEFEPGAFDRAFQDEQGKDPAMENVVMALNDLRARSGSQTPNTIKSVEECLGDISKLQKKLTEATKFNGAVQRRNKEIEEENIYLKEKIERVGKDMSKMRELEDKNEELQEEIARNAKKRSEMQKRQENMSEEIEKMTNKLHEMETNNYHLSDEVERLTKKIKKMEKEFSEERSTLTSSMERERNDVISETEKRVDEQKSKNKKLEDEIDNLRSDIKTLKDAKRVAEEKYVDDTKELIERHNAELSRERSRYNQLQDELNNNAGAVRKVTEEWEQMLRNAVSRYEEDLQKNEDERRKLAAEFQGQKEEMKAKFDKEKRNLELRIQEIETIGLVSTSPELNRENFEGLYQRYQNETHMEAPRRFNDDGNQLSNGIAERQDKIRALMKQKQNLEERLQQMQKNHDNEKNDLYKEQKKEKQKLKEMIEEEYKRKLEESKRYYEGQLDDLRRKHEKEKEDLEYKFKRETRDMQEKMKHEITSGLSSRSPELENKIQDLVSSKVQEQKYITKNLEMQLRIEKEKNNTVLMHMKNKLQNERSELKKRFDREKKVLEATVQALTKELAKLKQEKKELKKKQKKERAEMEEVFENEKKEMKQMWEKCKLDTITQIEDEWSEKLISERARLEMDKDEVRVVFEAKIKDLKLKFKSEKADYESRLNMVTSESNSLAEAKKEIQAALEDEYGRKLQKEKENIESTLQGLRQEIQRLQEHRKQLQSQMTNREGHFKDNAQPAPESPSKLLSKLDQEYQEHMKREKKQQHEGRMKEMETEIQKLHDDLSEMKVKARQEKSRLKTEFEREREEIEEQFDRERNDWRRRMAFISAMQPRDQKRSADKGHLDPRQ